MNDFHCQTNAPKNSETDAAAVVRVRDLGKMPYAEAIALQRALQRDVIEARTSEEPRTIRAGHLLLVEHDPPVITITRRPESRHHLVATETQLRRAGIELAETDRGGDITYHGPGQLVVYPILDLNVLDLRLGSYMRWLEQIVIDVLAPLGLEGVRDSAAPGVWVRSRGGDDASTSTRAIAPRGESLEKICAMGVRISRWVSMHGLALNVAPNLEHFRLIVPCGLAGRGVTSVQRELGARCPALGDIKSRMVERFQSAVRQRIPA
jgi:lipoyl(octanoyl) transferase